MKKATILLFALLLGFNALAAEDEKEETSGLFESLRKKIELLTPKKKLTTTKAVGGVRGALADAGELYWKGEEAEPFIDADELAVFDGALSHAEAGDKAAAEQGLSEFLGAYPDSQLRSDAEQALAVVKAMPEPAPAPAPAPEEPDDVAAPEQRQSEEVAPQ